MHQYIKTFKINLAALVVVVTAIVGFALPAVPAYAASDNTGDLNTTKRPLCTGYEAPSKACPNGGKVVCSGSEKSTVSECPKGHIVYQPVADCNEPYAQLNSSNCNIIKMITIITNILSTIAGVVIVLMIIVGGIQYSSAGANPQAVAAARGKIRNAIVALFLFAFMYSFLQWLIPGGIFK